MVFKTAHNLNSEDIETVRNIKTTSNNLVKKVLAEETTYTDECKKLMKYDEEEFYQKRDELIDALNLYKLGAHIGEEEKINLSHKLFHSELKELRNKKLKWNSGCIGGFLGAAGLFTLAGVSLVTGPALFFVLGYFGGWGSFLTGVYSSTERPNMSSFLVHHIALKTYAGVLKKSKDADNFMRDVSFLKLIDCEDYIDNMYKNNAKEFIDYFSSLKDVEEKKKIISLIYDSEYKNEKVISWLDANEPKLVRDVALENF